MEAVSAVLMLPAGGAWSRATSVALRRVKAEEKEEEVEGGVAYCEVARALEEATGLDAGDVRLLCGGREWHDGEVVNAGLGTVMTVQVLLRLVGGKGGFGSMLRSQGGRMASKQSTNYEACRDLNGRRLKVISDAKALNDWNEKQETMRREKEDQRKRKIERALNEESEPKKKHFLGDPNYVSETAALVESVASAVDEGLLQSSKIEAELAEKKAKEQAAVHKAAKKLGMWDEVVPSDSSDEEEDDDDSNAAGSASSAGAASSRASKA